MKLITEYPLWFIIFCIAAGIIYAGILYFKNKKQNELSVLTIRLIALLRFVVVTFLCFLLLSPLLKTVSREVEKPIIVFAQDNSESIINNKDSAFYKTTYKQQLQQLLNQLGDKYEVHLYSFADKVKEVNAADSLSFNEKQTDISNLFSELETRYSNRNTGAIILATDGLYNRGNNPVYSSDKLKIPVYTIALGDTTVKRDLILQKVNHNRVAYLGNKFPLEIIINARQLRGKTTTLTITKNGAALFSQSLNVNSDAYNTTIPVFLDAKESGLQHYKIKLATIEGEVNTNNNNQDVFIDVLDSKQKVVIIAAAPHPDVAAIKESLESNQNYEVESYTIDKFDKPLKKYNLVILHQLPGSINPASKILNEIAAADIPVWGFSGASTLLKNDLSIAATAQKSNECEAVMDANFSLFTISDELRKGVKNFPAVVSPYGNYSAADNSNVLFYQRIGIVDTKTPLMSFSSSGENKTAIFYGEGIWKWRLNDFSINQNHSAFDELISKTVQYLSVKANKSFFRVICKNNFMENQPIEMEAEVYNESYELINEPEVNITIINADNKKFQFTFGKTTDAYRLNAGMMPVGEYKYDARVKVGEKIFTQRGEFSVSALQVEILNTIADHQTLYALAKKHGGDMLTPTELDKLAETLSTREDIKAISYTQNKLADLINLKWLFFLVIAFLSIEWFVRKRNGLY